MPKQPSGRNPTRRVGNVVILAAIAAIAYLTLRPAAENAVEPRWACLVCGSSGAADVLVNILLYVPYGVGLMLAGMRPHRALALVVASTFAVELLQYRVIVGRDGTLSDVLTNSLGGGLGILLVRHWRALLVPNERRGASYAVAWSILCAAVLVTSARGLDIPSQLAGAVVRWKPVMASSEQFSGTLETVSINGRPTANWEHLAPVDAPGDSVSITARLRPSITGRPSSPIVWVGYGDRDHIVLSQVRTDLMARFRVRAASWRLTSPTFSLPRALEPRRAPDGSRDAEPTRATAVAAGHVVTLESEAPNGPLRRSVRMGATLGWTLMMPMGIPTGPGYRWITALWIGALLFPLGYWAVPRLRRDREPPGGGVRAASMERGRIPTLAAGAALLTGALSLGGISPLLAGVHTEWWEWLAAILAVAAGGATAFIALRIAEATDAGPAMRGHASASEPHAAGGAASTDRRASAVTSDRSRV